MKLSKAETLLSSKSWEALGQSDSLTYIHICQLTVNCPMMALGFMSWAISAMAVWAQLFQEVYTLQKTVLAYASRSPEDLNSLLLLVGGVKLQCCMCSIVEEKVADSHSNSNVTWSPHISFQHPFQEQSSWVKYFSLVLWRAPGDE